MKTHRPIDLVTELVRSPEPLNRRNATVALGTLGTQESTALLLDVGLTDKDADVRTRAEQELALVGAKSEYALRNLTAALHDRLGDEKTCLAAYALLGQLRSQGLPIPLPKLGIMARMSLAARSRTARTSYYRPILMGTVLASAAMLLFSVLVAPGIDTGDLTAIFLFSCLAPAFTVLVFSRLWPWKPVSLETDLLGGILADLRIAVAEGALVGVIVLVVSGLVNNWRGLTAVWLPLLEAIALVFAVRMGCACAFGSFRRRTPDITFSALAGTASGIAAITLLHFVFRATTEPGGPTTAVPNAPAAVASTAWLMLMPISAGFAATISGVDHQAESRRTPVFGRPTRISIGVLSIVVASFIALAGWPAPAARDGSKNVSPGSCVYTHPGTESFNLAQGMSGVCYVSVQAASQVLVQPIGDASALSHSFLFTWSGPGVSPTSFPSQLNTVVWVAGGYRLDATPATAAPRSLVIPSAPGYVFFLASQHMYQRTLGLLKRNTQGSSAPLRFTLTVTVNAISSVTSLDGSPEFLNEVCWTGSIRGFYDKSAVRKACEDAVERSSGEVDYRDSRGLNLALNGHYAEAIDDFRAYAKQSPDQIKAAERLKWVYQLEKNQNPFTKSELNRIINE